MLIFKVKKKHDVTMLLFEFLMQLLRAYVRTGYLVGFRAFPRPVRSLNMLPALLTVICCSMGTVMQQPSQSISFAQP